MAQRVIQLLRSGSVYASKQAAMDAIAGTGQTPAMQGQDGEVRIARYYGPEYTSGNETVKDVKDLLCVYHACSSEQENDPGWTFIEDASDVSDILNDLDANINTTMPVTKPAKGTAPTATDNNKVVTAILEFDGQVYGTATNVTSILLDSYAVGTDAKIAATDSLGGALGKLQGQINAMDLTEVGGGDGDVITTVSEADGKVSATAGALTDVKMTGYAADSTKTGAIAATDTLEQAFNKVENAIAANEVHSNDKTVTVTSDTTNGGTNLAVNIDGTTIVKNSTTGVLKADLKLTQLTDDEVTALSDANVKEAYKLIYATDTTNRTAIGNVVKIYKDSALQEVYLGSNQDTIDSTTGKITKQTVTDPQSMNFAYQLADGTYSLTMIDVSKFLTESEFGNGLQVNNAVVSVKKDTTSGKVRIADAPASGEDTGLVDVLTVSSDGVKVDNIQDAIDYAVSQSVAVQAQGDEYVGASVDPNNNKKVIVKTDVQYLTADAGTVGVYDSTTGAQTTAPTNGTLSGTANSLADGADIATNVKTYVDGQVAIEEARSDAKNKADIYALTATERGNLDNSDELTTGHKVGVKVVEEHGLITGVTVVEGDIASATEVDNIEEAVGLNTDGTFSAFSGTNYLNSTTTIKGAITALDTELGNGLNSVSNTDHSITVGTKSSKNQEISLNLDTTTGNDGGLNGYSSSQGDGGSGSNVLKVTENGLYLSEVWDCGTFA